MPFQRPTLPELIDRNAQDIETRLPGTDARLRRSNLGVLSRVHSGAVHGSYGYLSWLALQLMPDTAEVEYLNRWSSIWGIARKAASKASGNLAVTGTTGAVIPAGTVWQRKDGARFIGTAEATITAGTATVAIQAEAAGLAGNTAVNTTLTLVSPIAGVQSAATVAAGGLAGGAETESDDSLRVRLLTRIRQPPHGGAKFDYTAWALEVAGVTRAWCYPLELGAGTVVVRFMMDDTYADGIPHAGDVTTVSNHIDPLRPVAVAGFTVHAPVAVPLNLTIQLVTATTQAVKDAVTAELKDLIRREAIPGGTLLISHIREAISTAAGEYDHVLTTPNANVTVTTGQITTMGVITWV